MIRLLLLTALLVSGLAIAKPKPVTMIPVQEFNEAAIAKAADALTDAAYANKKVVGFEINTFGGSVWAGSQFIEFVKSVKRVTGIRTVCVVDGNAFSMGFIFLQSEACDLRLMTKRSTLLAHECRAGAHGTVAQIQKMAVALNELNEIVLTIQCKRLKIPCSDVKDAIAATGEWTVGPKDALRAGAVDDVIPNSFQLVE